MRSPIKTFDRYATFPVVLMIYGLLGYWSFIQPDYLLFLQLPFALVSLMALGILIFYGRKIRFARQTTKPALFPWLLKLWAGIVGFIFIALIIQVVLSSFNPYVARMYISPESYWETLQPLFQANNWYYWGFFAAFICWVIGLSYVYYNKDGVPCAHRMAAPLIARYFRHKKWSIWAKAFGESHLHLVTLTWFGLVVLSVIVLLASALLGVFKIPTYFTIPIISMSFFSLLFMFFASAYFGKSIKKLNRVKLDLSGVTFLLVFFILVLLFLAGVTIKFILMHNPDILKLVECDCTLNKLKLFTEIRMETLGWGIWILTLPIMATFVTRISKGRSILEVTLGILSVAGTLQVLGYFFTFDEFIHFVSSVHQTPVQFLLGGGLAIFLLVIFYKHQNSWIFSNGLMKPLARKNEDGIDLYRVSEVSLYDGTKIRGLGGVSRKWAAMSLGLLLIHTIGGWQVLQVELALFAFVLVGLYIGALMGLLIEWAEDGVFSKSPRSQTGDSL